MGRLFVPTYFVVSEAGRSTGFPRNYNFIQNHDGIKCEAIASLDLQSALDVPELSFPGPHSPSSGTSSVSLYRSRQRLASQISSFGRALYYTISRSLLLAQSLPRSQSYSFNLLRIRASGIYNLSFYSTLYVRREG